MFIQFLPGAGQWAFEYLYVVRFLDWGVLEYSKFTTFTTIVSLCGMAVFVPIFHRFCVPDQTIVAVTMITSMSYDIIKGFASKPWMFYLGKKSQQRYT